MPNPVSCRPHKSLRTRLRAALADPNVGGRGLRAWLARVEIEDRPFPAGLPEDLFAVYLSDAKAEPLYDCEQCGLPFPVRAAAGPGMSRRVTASTIRSARTAADVPDRMRSGPALERSDWLNCAWYLTTI